MEQGGKAMTRPDAGIYGITLDPGHHIRQSNPLTQGFFSRLLQRTQTAAEPEEALAPRNFLTWLFR